MEENNNEHLYSSMEDKPKSCFDNDCRKKCIAMTLAAFLGGFLAFYFVFDQYMERQSRPHGFHPKKFERMLLDDMDIERMYNEEMKAFDDMFKPHHKIKPPLFKHNELAMPLFMSNNVKIKTEFEDNRYNIIIGLKPFQNDENKVNYNIEGRKLTIFGNSQVKDKNYEQDLAFSQDFILPENADTANISKIKDGNKLIISVPIKD